MSFLEDIAANDVIAEAINSGSVSEHNFSHLEYVKHWDNVYTIQNINILNFVFKELSINITPGGTFINLFSDDIIFYEQAIDFFGTNGITHKREPYVINDQEVQEYRRKLGRFELLKKSINLSVLKSEAYRSVIKLTIIG